MKINVIGRGSFGNFLVSLLLEREKDFILSDDAETVILAVPISAYDECGAKFKDKTIVNICSVQKPSTDILLKHTNKVISIHPLFGQRTPNDKRNSIWTRACGSDLEFEFISLFNKISVIYEKDWNGELFTPDSHDKLMARTHLKAIQAALFMKSMIGDVSDIPDEFMPNSFRLVMNLTKTLLDTPKGTIDSILANPYA